MCIVARSFPLEMVGWFEERESDRRSITTLTHWQGRYYRSTVLMAWSHDSLGFRSADWSKSLTQRDTFNLKERNVRQQRSFFQIGNFQWPPFH